MPALSKQPGDAVLSRSGIGKVDGANVSFWSDPVETLGKVRGADTRVASAEDERSRLAAQGRLKMGPSLASAGKLNEMSPVLLSLYHPLSFLPRSQSPLPVTLSRRSIFAFASASLKCHHCSREKTIGWRPFDHEERR